MAARARQSGVVYLDSSALVKLVVAEPESGSLRRFMRLHRVRMSSALARTEVVRAVRHRGPEVIARARRVVLRIDLVRIDDALLDAAASLDAMIVRSLDAIHLASALSVAAELEALVTYDARMTTGAELLGLPVVAPA